MVLKQIQTNEPTVKWIGAHNPLLCFSYLQHKNAFFYAKCIIGPLTLSVGDYVLVSNADASDPDSIEGCDVARILNLYELREMSSRDPCRAIVQWYSRPESIPHKHFDSDEICIDFATELIEEHRPYDSDISLEAVFQKCSVICGPVEISSASLLENFKKKNCKMFVCRYKFIKVKNSYRLVPLQFANEDVCSRENKEREIEEKYLLKANSSKKLRRPSFLKSDEKEIHTQNCGMGSANTLEFIDVNYFNTENKVSPIKIIGGRSVVRLSEKKKQSSYSKNDPNGNYIQASPNVEKTEVTPRSKVAAAKRNLNLSLDNAEADSTADSCSLNYSIVKGSPDPLQPRSDIKIKLRLSERRRSSRLNSLEEDPLALQIQEQKSDVYQTPPKKLKETTEATPVNRRKSILKSATTKPAEGTPKRNIHLSDIVEKRIFTNDEIISTPKRTRVRKSLACTENEETIKINKSAVDVQSTPKKCKQKTPTKYKRNASKTENLEKQQATPAQKVKMLRSGEMKPSLEKRNVSIEEEADKTDLQIARERLHVSVVPNSLPCREKEFADIYTFLESKIQDQCGGCMYVSGVPGTGKTATVTGVIRSLQKKVSEDELPPFDFLEINGMRLTEPRQAYVHIYKQLTGKTLSWEHAHALLEKRFTTPAPRRITTVLLVDELDVLCNRRQDVVYNILDWPTKSTARLVVITIANTMDLPERLLMGKVTSRLGLTRLTFQPYTHKQLQEIVTGRLTGSDAFKSDAVQLVARKVAAVSGDARRALDICRRATEIADIDDNKAGTKNIQCVNISHVQQALAEMITSAKVQAIKNCSRLEQIFLQAVVAEVNRTGVEETSFMGVYSQIETIAAFMGTLIPTPGRALRICSKLGSERLLICEHSRNDIFQKILLNVSMDDIHYALKLSTLLDISCEMLSKLYIKQTRAKHLRNNVAEVVLCSTPEELVKCFWQHYFENYEII